MSRTIIDRTAAADFLRRSDGFLLLTHHRPDGDTVGSTTALIHALRALGKTAYACPNPELTPRYAGFLEPLYAPADFEPATVVSVDVAAKALIPDAMQKYLSRIALAIDHHGFNSIEAERVCVDPSSAACGELIFDLIGLLQVPLTVTMADALYAAVSTDTGCFRYSNTTVRTHIIAAALMEAGCHTAALNFELFELRTRGRVAIESAVMNNIRFFDGDTVACAFVSRELLAHTGATEDDMESLSSLPRNIDGVHVGITLYERAEGIKISVRTSEHADASAICRHLDGGGHARAAGCTVYNVPDHTVTMDEGLDAILAAVRAEAKEQ